MAVSSTATVRPAPSALASTSTHQAGGGGGLACRPWSSPPPPPPPAAHTKPSQAKPKPVHISDLTHRCTCREQHVQQARGGHHRNSGNSAIQPPPHPSSHRNSGNYLPFSSIPPSGGHHRSSRNDCHSAPHGPSQTQSRGKVKQETCKPHRLATTCNCQARFTQKCWTVLTGDDHGRAHARLGLHRHRCACPGPGGAPLSARPLRPRRAMKPVGGASGRPVKRTRVRLQLQ